MSISHNRALSEAFDDQAPKFEKAPVQSDPDALKRLVRGAGFPQGSRVLDTDCGPGLVSEALLAAGYKVVGVDLSRQMIQRAQKRCEAYGTNAEFLQISLNNPALDQMAPFDGALSRYVLHHVEDPAAFVARQVKLVRPGGRIVIYDHITDPLPDLAARHEAIEKARDKTHTRNLTGGQLIDLLAGAGLTEITYVEESFTLDFDEWFDRGTPSDTKENVRAAILETPPIRGYTATLQPDGSITIFCIRGLVVGVKPES